MTCRALFATNPARQSSAASPAGPAETEKSTHPSASSLPPKSWQLSAGVCYCCAVSCAATTRGGLRQGSRAMLPSVAYRTIMPEARQRRTRGWSAETRTRFAFPAHGVPRPFRAPQRPRPPPGATGIHAAARRRPVQCRPFALFRVLGDHRDARVLPCVRRCRSTAGTCAAAGWEWRRLDHQRQPPPDASRQQRHRRPCPTAAGGSGSPRRDHLAAQGRPNPPGDEAARQDTAGRRQRCGCSCAGRTSGRSHAAAEFGPAPPATTCRSDRNRGADHRAAAAPDCNHRPGRALGPRAAGRRLPDGRPPRTRHVSHREFRMRQLRCAGGHRGVRHQPQHHLLHRAHPRHTRTDEPLGRTATHQSPLQRRQAGLRGSGAEDHVSRVPQP